MVHCFFIKQRIRITGSCTLWCTPLHAFSNGRAGYRAVLRSMATTTSSSCSDLIDIIAQTPKNHADDTLSKAFRDYRLKHNASVSLRLDPQGLSTVLFSLIASGQSTQTVKSSANELINGLDEAEIIGTLDIATHSWTKSKLRAEDQNIKYMEIAKTLIEAGDSPISDSGVHSLKLLFCPHHNRTHDMLSVKYNEQLLNVLLKRIDLSKQAKDGRRLNFVKKWFLVFLAQWTAVIPPQLNRIESLQKLAIGLHARYEQQPGLYNFEQMLYTKTFTKTPYLSVYFWPVVIRSHPYSSLNAVLSIMGSLNVSTNFPEIQEALMLKQPDVSRCEAMIKEYEKTFHREAPSNVITHIYRVKAMNNQFTGVYNILQNIDGNTMSAYDKNIIRASMRGALEVKNYSQVIALYRFVWLKLGNNMGPLEEDSWIESYYIIALAWTGQEDLAFERLLTYWHKLHNADSAAVFAVVRGLIAKGRYSKGQAKRPMSQKYEPKEIINKLQKMLSSGIPVNSSSFFSDMFVQLGKLDITYREVQQLILGLCKAVAEQEKINYSAELKELHRNYKTSASSGELLPLSETTIAILDSNAIEQIVWLGFYKSPKQPWSSLDILCELYQAGIDVPLASVVNAFAQAIAKVYAPTQKGPTERIGKQMDQNMKIDDLLKIISEKFKLMS